MVSVTGALSTRITAKMVDLAVVFFAAVLLPYPIGPLSGFLYSLFGDSICTRNWKNQSLGKKLFKLRVIYSARHDLPQFGSEIQQKKEIGWKQSALRNAPVGVATFFAIIPIWGWLLAGLVGLPLMAIEVYLMHRAPRGQRLGDVMADTEVLEIEDPLSR